MSHVILTSFLIIISVVNGHEKNTSLNARILKGAECDPTESAYLAVIKRGKNVFCGATMLATHFGLTAAHCCGEMKKMWEFQVHAGMQNVRRVPEQRAGIKKLIIHSSYDTNPQLENDICVLEFDSAIFETVKVKYTTLATELSYPDILEQGLCKKALVMGYGAQSYKMTSEAKGRGYNPLAQCVHLEVLGKENCSQVADVIDFNSMYCAFDATLEGKDGCQGDSGGPMFCGQVQVGIVSAGFGCGVVGMPSFFSRVDVFSTFIDQSMKGIYLQAEVYSRSGWMIINPYVFTIVIVVIVLNKFYN